MSDMRSEYALTILHSRELQRLAQVGTHADDLMVISEAIADAILAKFPPVSEAELRAKIAADIRAKGDAFGAALDMMHQAVLSGEPHDFTTDDLIRYSAYTYAYENAATIAERTQR